MTASLYSSSLCSSSMLVSSAQHPRLAEFPRRRRIALLGATGSIGRSCLDIIQDYPEDFELRAIFAHSQSDALLQLAQEWQLPFCGLSGVHAELPLHNFKSGKFLGSRDEILGFLCSSEIDVVVCGVVGMAGLPYALAALESGKLLALANKESIVAGAKFLSEAKQRGNAVLIPVDSEHSALYQMLQACQPGDIRRMILTASGGPFLHTPQDDFPNILPEQAVRHPRWSMGAKISVDSSTLMNKALECIEAHFLYDMPPERISVLVHPQALVHSLLELEDGALLAQASLPDMREPIAYAMNIGRARLPSVIKGLRLEEIGSLHFEALDREKFPSIGLALQAMRAGPETCFLLNLANEVAVDAFLGGKLSFPGIFQFVAQMLGLISVPPFVSVEDVFQAEREIRIRLEESMSKGNIQ